MGLDTGVIEKQNYGMETASFHVAQARELYNPAGRAEIRPDFPRTLSPYDTKRVLEVINHELLKQGTILEEVGRITIAYPHKHPELFPGHKNNAEAFAKIFQNRMREAAPSIEWILADGICETRHLGRSENQTSVHALMSHQVYEIHKPSQKEPLPFIDQSNKKKEFFIITDSCMEQGTTFANLMNYIEHNGGSVLAASAGYCKDLPIAQSCFTKYNVPLSDKFNDPSRNAKRLPQLAQAFAESAKKSGENWSPEQCLEMFDDKLKEAGSSMFALTDGECKRLLETLEGGFMLNPTPFPELLKKFKVPSPPKA